MKAGFRILLVLLAGVLTIRAFYDAKSDSRGIDVSHFQGDVDWKKVASSGVSFAFAKATQGARYTDPKFAHNWEAMRSAGLQRGAYHFLDPSVDGTKQAQHFLSVVKPKSGDIRPVVDVEKIGNGGSKELYTTLTAFLAEIRRATGHDAIIYVSPAFWQEHIKPHMTGPWKNPLWIAEYGVKTPKEVDGLPPWSIWQHTERGKIIGIEGHVDLDTARKFEQLILP